MNAPSESFLQLKKIANSPCHDLRKKTIALLGDFATQHLSVAIKGYGRIKEYDFQMYESEYNQIIQETMDSDSGLYSSNPDVVIIANCIEMLYDSYCRVSVEGRSSFADKCATSIVSAWNNIRRNSSAKIIQTIFIELDDGVFGNYSLKTDKSFLYQVKKLNGLIIENAQHFDGVFLMDMNSCVVRYGYDAILDTKMYQMAKYPIKVSALPIIAKELVHIIVAIDGKIKKCVIADLDNTLWGGVIGDDGLNGIQIGDLGIGRAFSNMQQFLKELKNRGVLIAICSKNTEDIAKEPFIKHPDMILKMDDISIFVANWQDKATNIEYIQKTLNIGMDSIVFIDDNPFERNLVKQMIPDITVPEMPEDPSEYVDYLRSLNLFETASYSDEDLIRTDQYRAEVNRVELQTNYASLDDYLQDLNMIAEINNFDAFHAPRIAQLTQRSNQFNLRTIRLSEAEINAIASSPDYVSWYVLLKDKFGDYGLVSVIILEKRENSLFIYEWLMSCRVLKRGVEEFIMNNIVDYAERNHYSSIIGEYIETKKNHLVSNLYRDFGFNDDGNGIFTLTVADYKNKKSFVRG